MIISQSQSRLVDNIPDLDGGSLWVCNPALGEARHVPLSAADRVTLYPGHAGFFAVVHHYKGMCVEISVHQIDGDPGVAVSRIQIYGTTWRFEGNDSVWQHLPRAFVAFYMPEQMSEADDHLILVNSRERRAEIRKFPPFYGGDNDKGRVKAIIDVPHQPSVLVEQTRDEHPFVLLNHKRDKVAQRLQLAMKPGSARSYRFRETVQELWVSDPDHLVKLAPGFLGDWSVKGTLRLQLMDSTSGRYTGGFAFSDDELWCVVARPFLGDVVLVDTAKFEIIKRIQLEGMPRSIALLNDGRLFARDWSTGRLLTSSTTRRLAAA